MKKWFHLIGVSGKTTANIAKVFQEMGWFVTGSDNQFLPPASNLLEEYKINTAQGYDYTHLTSEFWKSRVTGAQSRDIPENPDLVLFISHLNTKNKEYLYARKKGLNIKPYAQILKEYLIKPESIVVIGTAGKTTTTALATFVLKKLDLDPSYMIGAEVLDIPESLKITDSQFSVIEGDEYHNPDPQIEGKAKFLEYKPKYLIITSIGWEHQDIFPTQEKYVEEFKKAVQLVPEDGLIIAHYGDANIDKALEGAKCKVIRYGMKVGTRSQVSGNSNPELVTSNHKPGTSNLEPKWTVEKVDEGYSRVYDAEDNPVLEFKTSLLGDYNQENILAVVTLLLNLPSHILPVRLIREGTNSLGVLSEIISEFKGPKKRLEKLFESENLVVIDDFGVAPNRAENSLKTLKEYYPDHKVVAIFEPNSGSRFNDETLFNEMYKDSFKNADEIIIPDLSNVNSEIASTEEMVERLNKLGFNVKHVSNDKLIEELKLKSSQLVADGSKLIIVFFSSYKLTEIAEEFVMNLN